MTVRPDDRIVDFGGSPPVLHRVVSRDNTLTPSMRAERARTTMPLCDPDPRDRDGRPARESPRLSDLTCLDSRARLLRDYPGATDCAECEDLHRIQAQEARS